MPFFSKVKSSVKKWAYLTKKKQWGFKYSTSVKLICKSGGEVEGLTSGSRQISQTEGINRFLGEDGQSIGATGLVRTRNVGMNGAT